jgi:hypothetical protein
MALASVTKFGAACDSQKALDNLDFNFNKRMIEAWSSIWQPTRSSLATKTPCFCVHQVRGKSYLSQRHRTGGHRARLSVVYRETHTLMEEIAKTDQGVLIRNEGGSKNTSYSLPEEPGYAAQG